MWLLHSKRFKLKEFSGSNIPPYAILSHRWDDCEVSFRELRSGKGPETKGWEKVSNCCRKAALDGWDYVDLACASELGYRRCRARITTFKWIDSCCIDKTSSAELSEAINSMFSWYSHAQVCYAYLSDVRSAAWDPYRSDADFPKSKWFTRGWTLQELLAPRSVEFFDCNWVEIGTKASLQDLITRITGIKHLFNYKEASVAQKMSWAGPRLTTRPEDEAYCLMGLFDVNMPPLYGEGHKAFYRLQLEILNRTSDESLFAWSTLFGPWSGLIAPSPRAFKDSGNIVRYTHGSPRPPPYMTNQGLRFNFRLAREKGNKYFEGLLALLNCCVEVNGEKRCVALAVQHQYNYRIMKRRQALVFVLEADTHFVSEEVGIFYFEQSLSTLNIIADLYMDPSIFLIKFPSMKEDGFSLVRKVLLRNGPEWDTRSEVLSKYKHEPVLVLRHFRANNDTAAILFRRNELELWILVIGITGPRAWIDSFTTVSVELMDTLVAESRVRNDREVGPDRISLPLFGGKFISVALKQSIDAGGLVSIVDITVDPAGRPRWPVKAKTQKQILFER